MDLTEEGQKQSRDLAKELLAQGFNNNNILYVFVSPLPRTRQTADALVKSGVVSKDKVIADNRLIEMQCGNLEREATIARLE